MKRFIATLALMFFLISFASASHDSYSNSYTDYSHPDEIVVRKTIQLNQDRYPTYDYRHGYTYRTTDEYKDLRRDKSRFRKTLEHRLIKVWRHREIEELVRACSKFFVYLVELFF